MLPSLVRPSFGTAVVLGLIHAKVEVPPTTAYLLTYRDGKCTANCLFCSQARESRSKADLLSRITWPAFQTETVIKALAKALESRAVKRVCIQALNYPGVLEDVIALASAIRGVAEAPISVSCQPLTRREMEKLRDVGVERVSVALDACTEELFERIKGRLAGGPYTWNGHWRALRDAVSIFGRGSVTTHLIIGLGERCRDAVHTIQRCVDIGVYPSLFAFTPIPGTPLEKMSQPPLSYYRAVQLAHNLITTGRARYEDMRFDGRGMLVDFGLPWTELRDVIRSGKPFMTSGCPGCNRPYYNERPSGPIYNYPRPLTREEIDGVEALFRGLLGVG